MGRTVLRIYGQSAVIDLTVKRQAIRECHNRDDYVTSHRSRSFGRIRNDATQQRKIKFAIGAEKRIHEMAYLRVQDSVAAERAEQCGLRE